jgi:hypothetical protein
MSAYPVLMHTALDATDCRSLAEFYRQFLGLRYRPGDEIPPIAATMTRTGWSCSIRRDTACSLFQEVPTLARPTWPAHDVPKQMHHDFRVPNIEELQRQRQRAEELGATLLYDRTDDDGEPLYVLADPAGHPFCLLVGSE